MNAPSQEQDKKYIGTIDCTPTWASIAPMLILALQDGTPTAKATACEEIKRMAKLADLYVKSRAS